MSKLKQNLLYIANPLKTEGRLSGIGVIADPEIAYNMMKTNKVVNRKTDGRQLFHSIFAYPSADEITPDVAHRLSCKVAKELYNGHPMLVATHSNTKFPRTHVVGDTLNIRTVKKFSQSKKQLLERTSQLNNWYELWREEHKKDSINIAVESDINSTEYFGNENIFMKLQSLLTSQQNIFSPEWCSNCVTPDIEQDITNSKDPIVPKVELIEPIYFINKQEMIEPIFFYNKQI